MSRGTVFGTALGLALLAALAVGGYLLLDYVGGVFTSLDPPIRTLAAIGSVVVLLSAVIIGEGLKARGASAGRSAAERVATYEQLLAACCEPRHLSGSADANGARELGEIERSLSLHGSPRVISRYLALRRSRHDHAPDTMRATLLRAMVREMRRDLGSGDLIGKESDLLELLAEPGRAPLGAHRRTEERAVHE